MKNVVKCYKDFFGYFNALKTHCDMTNLKYISSFIIFGQTRGIKWTVPSNFLAKKKQLSFFEGLRPIAASIKGGFHLYLFPFDFPFNYIVN